MKIPRWFICILASLGFAVSLGQGSATAPAPTVDDGQKTEALLSDSLEENENCTVIDPFESDSYGDQKITCPAGHRMGSEENPCTDGETCCSCGDGSYQLNYSTCDKCIRHTVCSELSKGTKAARTFPSTSQGQTVTKTKTTKNRTMKRKKTLQMKSSALMLARQKLSKGRKAARTFPSLSRGQIVTKKKTTMNRCMKRKKTLQMKSSAVMLYDVVGNAFHDSVCKATTVPADLALPGKSTIKTATTLTDATADMGQDERFSIQWPWSIIVIVSAAVTPLLCMVWAFVKLIMKWHRKHITLPQQPQGNGHIPAQAAAGAICMDANEMKAEDQC